MSRHPYDFISSIRITLQRLEEEFPSPQDQSVIAELKRILLLRLADLEFVGAAVASENAKEAKSRASLSLDEAGIDAA